MARIENKEQLEKLAAESRSIGEIARKLEYKTVKDKKLPGGVYKFIKAKLTDWNIDTSHFVGKGWAKGQTRTTDSGVDKQARKIETPWADAFRVGSRVSNQSLLKRLVLAGKRTYNCERCNINEWMGQPLKLELHHLNGINDDNREINLQIICPNCHSQQ
jgi:hypothetical protein